jgi:hypothetical protein
MSSTLTQDECFVKPETKKKTKKIPRRTVSPDISSVFFGFQWRDGLSVGIEGFVRFLKPTRKAIRNDRV